MSKSIFTVDEMKRKLEQYCIYQDRCHKEVAQKMNSFQLIPEAKEIILLHLLQHNFLNEERFSKSFARGKFRIKKWGKQRIIRELKYREISAYNIKTALKEINEEEYITTLYSLIEKKNNQISGSNIYKEKKKIINHLQYKGFENDLIYKAVNEILSEK